MKTMKTVLAIAIGVGLSLGAVAQEKVDPSTLPAPVVDTIKQKAQGGQIMQVIKHKDRNGGLYYDVSVEANGKTLGFVVDQNGKLLKE